MKQQLRPNRNITMGDRGEKAVKLSMTKAEKKEQFRNQVQVAKVRMLEWSDDFVKKVYYENSNKAWHQAAKETLNERKVPKDKVPPPKPHYTRTTITGKDTQLTTFTDESLKKIVETSSSPAMVEAARTVLRNRNVPYPTPR